MSAGGIVGRHLAVGTGSAAAGGIITQLDVSGLRPGSKVLIEQSAVSLAPAAAAGIVQLYGIYTTDGTAPTAVNGTKFLNSRVYAPSSGAVVSAPGGAFQVTVGAAGRVRAITYSNELWYRPDMTEMIMRQG
ncbi:MAG: hypothetical protein D3X82_16930 [Candidatus Leucobacter sulfamidivorax]|nr:hypothetical protein [Candidatus Leucobacter sulfamidivorax]